MQALIQLSAFFSGLALIHRDNPRLCMRYTSYAYLATVLAYEQFQEAL